jgi:hypothetical protein
MTERMFRTARRARRPRRPGFVLTVMSLPVAISVALGAGGPAALAASTPEPTWLINAHAVDLLRGAGASSALLTKAFGGTRAYVSGKPGSLGIPTATYDSYTAIKNAFADGALPGKYQAVLLDMEHWQFTPPAEQRSPAKYEQMAASLVHKHKAGGHTMLLIDAPAVDIVKARCACSAASSARQHYLQWDIPGGAARYADVIDIQAQNDERNLSSYKTFVAAAAKKARAAHPAVIVLAGLSTDNGAQEVLGGQLYQAFRDVRGLVAGFWLNIPGKSAQCPDCGGPYPKPALSLLRKIYG